MAQKLPNRRNRFARDSASIIGIQLTFGSRCLQSVIERFLGTSAMHCHSCSTTYKSSSRNLVQTVVRKNRLLPSPFCSICASGGFQADSARVPTVCAHGPT